MGREKMDRRKKYTRMVLKDSLLQLLKEKPITAITVKEICEHADINRSTFYAHYLDQYDLLNKIEEEMIEDLIIYLDQYNFEQEEESLQMTIKLLEYFVSKKEICQTLLKEKEETTFQRRIAEVAQSFLMKSWVSKNTLNPHIFEYASIYIICGSIEAIKHWLYNGMEQTSPKEMAEMIINLIHKGLYGISQLNNGLCE